MADILENSDYVVATKEGDSQRVTIVNPEPRLLGKNKIIAGLVVESEPAKDNAAETVSKLYLYGDVGTQGIRGDPKTEIVGRVQKIQDADYPVRSRAEPQHKARWVTKVGEKQVTFDASVTFIGEYDAATLPTLAENLEKLRQSGHFTAAFRDAALAAVDVSRERGGDAALKLGYQDVASTVRDSVKSQSQG